MGQESERKLASCDWEEDEFLGGNFLAAIQFCNSILEDSRESVRGEISKERGGGNF